MGGDNVGGHGAAGRRATVSDGTEKEACDAAEQ